MTTLRVLAGDLLNAVNDIVTTPSYAVELMFGAPVRMSSRQPVSIAGTLFDAGDFGVSSIAWGSGGVQSVTITLADPDGSLCEAVLNEGIGGRAFTIVKFYTLSNTLQPADYVTLITGVLSGGTISDAAVTLTGVTAGSQTRVVPERYVSAVTGFHHLPPDGSVLSWNGEVFTFKRGA